VIGGKTASLIRTSARLGAITGGAEKDTIEAISDWAWEMGMVFQITDDVLDLIASDEFLGKPAGSDIGEGTFTLPVLLAADGKDSDEIKTLLSEGKPYSQEAIKRVITLTVDGGYVDAVLDEAVGRIRIAEKAANEIPDNPLAPVLSNLDQYLLDRVNTARGA
jgi:geranylgeranyl pyrophosphate synthase